MAERVAVVGNGLIGSAAGRRLAELGHDVIVIGPAEPTDPAAHEGVFSSHYDEGRLVSSHGADPVWSWLARASLAEFDGLQSRSGVAFHHPIGRVSLLSSQTAEAVAAWAAYTDPDGRDLSVLPADGGECRERFPYLAVPAGTTMLHEGPPAGYLNPRSLLRAQNLVAEQLGARIVTERVESVRARGDRVDVATDAGSRFEVDRVVVAAGAFTNFGELLPQPVPLRLKTETTVRGEVSETTARSCAAMPVITADIDHPALDDVYLAPPVRYPDGVYRVKMGCNTANESWPESLDEVRAWFRSGESDLDLDAMEAVLRELLPGIEIGAVTTHRCIVSYTPSGYPTVDAAPGDEHGRVVVATGGNGTGAQASDALGRLAAELVHDGRWPDELPRGHFRSGRRWDEPTDRLSKAQRRARQSDDTA